MNQTSHLGFAAYLMIKGYSLISEPSKDVDNKFRFTFEIEKCVLDKLYLEFSTSDFQRYDNALIGLKRKLSRHS